MNVATRMSPPAVGFRAMPSMPRTVAPWAVSGAAATVAVNAAGAWSSAPNGSLIVTTGVNESRLRISVGAGDVEDVGSVRR